MASSKAPVATVLIKSITPRRKISRARDTRSCGFGVLPKFFYRVIRRSRPCAVSRLPICHVRHSPLFIETPMGDWLCLRHHPRRNALVGNFLDRPGLEIAASEDEHAQ